MDVAKIGKIDLFSQIIFHELWHLWFTYLPGQMEVGKLVFTADPGGLPFCVQMKLVPSNNSSFCPFLLVWMVPLNSFTFIIFHSSWILPSQLFSFIVMAVRNFIITLINRNRVTLGLLMITFGHQNQNTHFFKVFGFGDFMLFTSQY